jgi:hypothetical protein
MGRSEGNSSAGAIAVVVIAGILLLGVLGCGGLFFVGWLFLAVPSPVSMGTAVPAPVATTTSAAPPAHVRIITNDAEGRAVVDGQAYSDEELLQLLIGDQAVGTTTPEIQLQFTDNLLADRQSAIEEVVARALLARSGNIDSNSQEKIP